MYIRAVNIHITTLKKVISDYEDITHLENIINQLDTNITNYLLEIARAYHNPGSHIDNYTKNLEIVKNLERIDDLNLNLVGFFHLMNQNNVTKLHEIKEVL